MTESVFSDTIEFIIRVYTGKFPAFSSKGGYALDTVARLNELMEDRGLSIYGLAKLCDIPYSTLKNTVARSGQLSLDSIERICEKLEIPVYEFFMTDEDWDGIEAYAIRRMHLHEQGAERTAV